ncbi:HEAT repeat domain-containing protein [Flavobacterium denitrificans]|uniref:HEAT repeat domain-containing protein n=1 Tax=Flavobacterium denitrificans TaxID=281361 RepID=UPI00041DAD7C|nr:HEAT repeat domain-containing protein [Flavobacterium denitrificans]
MEQLIGYIKNFVIPFFLIITISLIVILLFKRIRYQYTLPYRHHIIRKSEIFLTEITLSKPDENILKYKISQFKSEIPIHKNWCKNMLIDDMIRMKSNLKGKTAKNILSIYKQLDLNHYSASLIRDFRNYKKCLGFYHFQAMGYKPGIHLIKKYLLHPNQIILSNANIAFLALSKGNWLALDKIPVKVSRITTIKVMDVLHSENIPIPKDIDLWIHSEKKAILKLAVMTMVFYNYRNKSAEIIKLLNHEHKALRTDVIIAIRELFLYEAEDELLSIINYETRDTQIEILETLAVIGTKKTIAFLRNKIPKQEIKDVKLKMVFCYNNLDSKGVDKLGLQDPDTQKMINHIRKLEL